MSPVPSDPHVFADGPGNTASGVEVNERFDPLYAALDGALDASNIAPGGVEKANLASDALNAFVKLNTPENRKLAFGSASISWAGGTDISQTLTVNHGLGVTPVFFAFFMEDQDGTGPCAAFGNTRTSTAITAKFKTTAGFTPAAGDHGTACWVAIG